MSRRLPVVAAGLAALVAAVPASAGAPAATTGPATSIGARSAIVSGTVDPGGKSTTWSIEYGTTSAYDSRSDSRSAGNGTSAVDVTHQLTGLSTGVTYYYRVVATNDDGTSRGAGMTFTTRGAPVRTSEARSIRTDAPRGGGSSTERRAATETAPRRGRPAQACRPSASPSVSAASPPA